MDPNIKLVLDEMAKLRVDIKDGFMVQEAAFSKRLEEIAVVDRHRDTQVASLEEAASTFSNTLAAWRPEVNSSTPSSSSSPS
jgi:hypothetical protein